MSEPEVEPVVVVVANPRVAHPMVVQPRLLVFMTLLLVSITLFYAHDMF